MNEEFLNDMGWKVESTSPLAIRHEDGSFVSGEAAHMFMDIIKKKSYDNFKHRKRLREIIGSHKWIKIKKFDENQVRFKRFPQVELDEFKKHHTEETEFLIKKCRELARELLEFYKEPREI